MIAALSLTLALAAGALQDPAGSLRGTVRAGTAEAALAGATVEIGVGAARRTVVTDSAGGYRLAPVPVGRRVVRAWRVDHEPLEVEVDVPPGREVALDLWLRPRTVALPALRVRGRSQPAADADAGEPDTLALPNAALRVTGMRSVESTPGISELGLGEQPRGAPGQAPADPSDVLYVRGSSAELKLVLLDGAPVYTPFHLGGLLESFEADALGGARLYLGGAPARYDGGLAYILDLSTRSGRPGPLRSSGAVDLLSARLSVEGSATERVRYHLGGRTLHPWGTAALTGERLPYTYEDGLARVDVRLSGESTLRLTGFHNREGAWPDTATGSAMRMGWGNRALSAYYRGRLAGARADVGMAWSHFYAHLPLGAPHRAPNEGSTRRLRATADFAREVGPLGVGYGASFDRMAQRSWHRAVWPLLPAPDTRVDRGDAAGGYLEASWQPVPRLRARGGVRADLFSVDPAPRLSPRLSATWLLSERAALSLAGGRYHQLVRSWAPVAVRTRAPRPDTVFLPAGLAVGRASHLSMALHQEMDLGVWLGLEGFYKSFDGVSAPGADRAHASGVDVWVRRDEGRVRGWLGYSLSWVWSDGSGRSHDAFEGRQALSAAVSGSLGRWGEADVRVAYGAGLPFTSIPLSGPASPELMDVSTASTRLATSTRGASESLSAALAPDESYLRLDLGLTRTFTPEWQGRSLRISPYLRVLNALNRRDALFYHYQPGNGAGPRPLSALPLLPVLGVAWRF
jgi:hypothetical protein